LEVGYYLASLNMVRTKRSFMFQCGAHQVA
jgi:hypothetical protein